MSSGGNPVSLITGTSRGIGLHLAERFLEYGHHVVGCSRSEGPDLGPHYRHRQLDVSDERSVRELLSSIRKTEGRLDHLVNNAGIAVMNHSMLTPVSTLRSVLEVNVVGTFLFCRESAKLMRASGGGRIVNFSTVAVPLRLAGESVYVASKAAVESLTHVLAREFADLDITVNAVGPTPVDTNLIRSVPGEKIDGILDRQAIRRMGTFEDVENVVAFFLRPESGMVTGQVIYLGGV